MRGAICREPGTRSVSGAAAAGRALCPRGPGARQLPEFHLPPAGPHQTPGSATQVSAAAARRDPVLGWELGPRQGASRRRARWTGGGRRVTTQLGEDQGLAHRGLMLDPGRNPGGGCCVEAESGWVVAGLEGPRPSPALGSPGLLRGGSRAPEPRATSWLCAPGEERPRRPREYREGDEAGNSVASWELGTAPGCG